MEGFTVQSLRRRILLPEEDHYSLAPPINAGAVADGITRDCKNGKPLQPGFRGALNVLSYPGGHNPAKQAATTTTRRFTLVLRDFKERNEKAVYTAIEEANKALVVIAQCLTPKPDYLVNDLPGCTFSGAVLGDGAVHYGFICDSGVALLDENGRLKFRTEDQGPNKFDRFIWQDERLRGLSWQDAEARKIVRSEYRNNPLQANSFGALTGEPAAMHYVRVGTLEVRPSDTLLLYTDGLEHAIFDKGDVSGQVAHAVKLRDFSRLRKLCKSQVKSEGTLIYFPLSQ